MYGVPQQPKVTKVLIEQYIAYLVKADNLVFTRLSEAPRYWRHSCTTSGAIILPVHNVDLYGVPLQYSVCGACRKVHYYCDNQT